jgi:hypothetical protein
MATLNSLVAVQEQKLIDKKLSQAIKEIDVPNELQDPDCTQDPEPSPHEGRTYGTRLAQATGGTGEAVGTAQEVPDSSDDESSDDEDEEVDEHPAAGEEDQGSKKPADDPPLSTQAPVTPGCTPEELLANPQFINGLPSPQRRLLGLVASKV